MVSIPDAGARQPWCQSQLPHSLSPRFWANYLNSLCPILLLRKKDMPQGLRKPIQGGHCIEASRQGHWNLAHRLLTSGPRKGLCPITERAGCPFSLWHSNTVHWPIQVSTGLLSPPHKHHALTLLLRRHILI